MPECCGCFTRRHGEEPDMGDDWNTFEPGTCTTCGATGTVFTITI